MLPLLISRLLSWFGRRPVTAPAPDPLVQLEPEAPDLDFGTVFDWCAQRGAKRVETIGVAFERHRLYIHRDFDYLEAPPKSKAAWVRVEYLEINRWISYGGLQLEITLRPETTRQAVQMVTSLLVPDADLVNHPHAKPST